MEITELSTRGQITLPKKIRDKLKLKAGDILETIIKENLIILKKLNNGISEKDTENVTTKNL